jgi:hypothetical protein
MIVSGFIIQANVITIVNYDHKTFIVQAIGYAEFSYFRFRFKREVVTGKSDQLSMFSNDFGEKRKNNNNVERKKI